MNQGQWLRIALVLLLALGLATSAVAQGRDPRLNDSQEPGSVIVFPKFIRGTTDGGEPRSEFEISVVCPFEARQPFNTGCTGYGEGYRVKIRAHWVCPGEQDITSKFICRETDFDLFTTVFGTVSFNTANVGAAAGLPIGSGSSGVSINIPPTVYSTTVHAQRVPTPPCEEGYLIAWVVDAQDRPIKFDALIGDAILRAPNGAVSGYNATPIQAAPDKTTGALIENAPGALAFDGTNYQAVPGLVSSSLRFEQLREPPADTPTPFTSAVRTDLTLLTLDVNSNAPNLATYVELDFFNANEYLLSTFWEFICWTQVRLTDIDPFLSVDGMQTRKGLVVSGQAQKFPFLGIDDTPGPVTLFGLITTEVTTTTALGPPIATTSQSYTHQLFNYSFPTPTNFYFKPIARFPNVNNGQ